MLKESGIIIIQNGTIEAGQRQQNRCQAGLAYLVSQ